ncbi:MAG TPA: CsgG/HfaB family protein [Usitatibacter sp.]|nr:CsgG/HfaB family protein [Usitatibacter sp.]
MKGLAALALGFAAACALAAEPSLPGPKRAVVVDKFQSNSQFDAAYGSWDVGGGLAAMLTTALQQSGQFVVLERASMGSIIFEQELKSNNVANPETGPKLGQVAAAQFVVVGAVTEFGVQDKGGSFNIGIGGAVKGNPLSSLLGGKHAEGAVAFDLRIIDTSTTQVVQTVKVKEPISQTSFNASVDYKAMNMGGDQFDNTPLGEASRKAIDRAVAEIISTAAREPWHALLVDYDGKEAVINAGRNSGVKAGDHFTVQRIMQRLTDPATGEVLAVKRVTLGTLEVTSVEDKVAFATFATAEGNQPVRGDLVTSQ